MMWTGPAQGATAGALGGLGGGIGVGPGTVERENPLAELTLPQVLMRSTRPEPSPSVSPDTLRLIERNPALYTCRVLRGEIEGVERVLLILGESHRKTERAGKIGEEIIAEFNDIGYEGSVPGRFARFVATVGDRFSSLAQSFWCKIGKLERGSSIDDAETIARVGRERINYATEIMLAAEKRGLDLGSIESFPADFALPVNDELVPVRHFPGRVFAFGIAELRGDDIIALARSMADRVKTEGIFRVYEGERRATKRMYHLEAGFQTGVIETVPDLFGIGTGALIAWGLYSSVTAGSAGFALYLGAALNSSHLIGLAIQKLVPERAQDSRWYDWCTGVTHALNIRRDGVMTENVGRMFERNPICTKALCIVGAAHVGPIAARLVAAGWRQEFAVYEPNLWSMVAQRFDRSA